MNRAKNVKRTMFPMALAFIGATALGCATAAPDGAFADSDGTDAVVARADIPDIAAVEPEVDAAPPDAEEDIEPDADADADAKADAEPATPDPDFANVTQVAITGTAGAYTFAVTLKSPDTGCDQYANWWELVDATNQTLIVRRILGHSHVAEQPFTRSQSGVDVTPSQDLIIRAHLNTVGYGGVTFRGNITDGFIATATPEVLPEALETTPPLPTSCAF